jgi:hypothetical protein
MANLQANLRSQCATALDAPERFLCSVNPLFREHADNAYATLLYVGSRRPHTALALRDVDTSIGCCCAVTAPLTGYDTATVIHADVGSAIDEHALRAGSAVLYRRRD